MFNFIPCLLEGNPFFAYFVHDFSCMCFKPVLREFSVVDVILIVVKYILFCSVNVELRARAECGARSQYYCLRL